MLSDCSFPIKLGQAINFEGFFKMFHDFQELGVIGSTSSLMEGSGLIPEVLKILRDF